MMRWHFGQGEFDHFHRQIGAGGIVGLVLMIILWAAVIAALVLGIRALILYARRNGVSAPAGTPIPGTPPPGAPAATATALPHSVPTAGTPPLLATLELRYARGEIDRDEFLQKRQDLGLG